MAGVVAAKKGTEEDREKAVMTLLVGVKQIQAKVGKHLIAMKQETKAMAAVGVSDADATEGASDAPHPKGAVAMGKMTALLVKLGRKIKEEIKDPANKHNPKVLLDIKLFLAVKEAVEKTQALMMAGSAAIKNAKTDEEKELVQAAIKKGMGKVETTLKSKMMALEKQALLLSVAAAQAAKKHEAEGEPEDVAEDKPARKKSHGDDEDEKGDDEAEDEKAKVPATKKKGKKARGAEPEEAEPEEAESEDAKADDGEEKADDAKADDAKADDADDEAAAAPAKKHKKHKPAEPPAAEAAAAEPAIDESAELPPREDELADALAHLRTH